MKKIPLTQGKFTLVDDENYTFLSQWRWYAWKCGKTYYARRNSFPVKGSKKRHAIYMHRVVAAVAKGEIVDHRNHNGLDNRACNVRKCTQSQNQQNQIPKRRGESQYKGVSRSYNNWRARIKYKGKRILIGTYKTDVAAAIAYNKKAKELFGEFANVNLIAAALAAKGATE